MLKKLAGIYQLKKTIRKSLQITIQTRKGRLLENLNK
jgi:hypothetical protein